MLFILRYLIKNNHINSYKPIFFFIKRIKIKYRNAIKEWMKIKNFEIWNIQKAINLLSNETLRNSIQKRIFVSVPVALPWPLIRCRDERRINSSIWFCHHITMKNLKNPKKYFEDPFFHTHHCPTNWGTPYN